MSSYSLAAALAGVLVLAACTQQAATPEPPAIPGAATPPVQTTATRAEARPPAGADSAPLGPGRLDPEVQACLSAQTLEDNQDRDYYEVVRMRGSNGLFVYIATVDPDDREAEVESALLLFQEDGTCVSMLDYGGVFYSFEEAAPEDVEGPLSNAFGQWVAAWRRGESP